MGAMMFRSMMVALFAFLSIEAAHSQAAPSTIDQIKAVVAEIKSKASLKLSPTTDQSAIEAAGEELRKLKNITVAASIDESGANLAIAQQLKKDGKLRNPRFKFAKQAVDGTIQYVGPVTLPVVGALDVEADLHARMATSVEIDTSQQSTSFKIGFSVTALEVQNLKVSRDGKPVSWPLPGLAEAVINGVLIPAQDLLNHIELRLPTTLAAEVEPKPSQRAGLTTSFDPKVIRLKLTITGVSHIIDSGRIIAVLQERGTTNNIAGQPKPVAFDVFRAEFQNKLASGGVAWMNQGQLSAYVDRELISSLTSRVMSSGPICMSARAKDVPVPFSTKVKLPATETIDCTPTRDCTPKGECRQNMECAQNEECRRCRKALGAKVCWNDPGCELGKKQRKASCELAKKTAHDACELDKSKNKAACEATKLTEKGACEAFKGSYDAIRRAGADYANVDSKNLVINGDARICINELTFDQAALSFKGKLQVAANAKASGDVKFTPLNIAGHATCFTPVEKPVNIETSVPPQDVEIEATANMVDDAAQLSLVAKIANPVRVRFPVGSVARKLAADDDFTIRCPVPGIATKVRAITPESWWPKEARGDIERELPDFRFELDFVKKPLVVNGLQISGNLRKTKAGVGGVFTLKAKAK